MKRTSLGTRNLRGWTIALGVGLVGSGCIRSPRYNPSFSANPYAGVGGYGAGTDPTGGVGGAGGGAPTLGGPVAGGGDAMAAADRALRAQGFQPIGQPLRQQLPARGLVSFAVPAQPGMCYTVVAVGDAGVGDIDMEMIAPSGTSLGEDRNPDTHPNVSFCATEYGMHLARVSMFSGSGSVAFAAYQGPAGTYGNLAGAFGGTSGAGAAQALSTPDPGTNARIQNLNTLLASQGYAPTQQPIGIQMSNRQEQSWPINLPAGGCYSFATFGGPGANDSDVFLFDAGGARRLYSDAGGGADAVIRDICPSSAGVYQLRARLRNGNGPVWLIAYSRGGTTGAGAQTALTLNAQASGAGGIEAFFRRVDRDLLARGYGVVGSPVSGELAAAGVTSQAVNLQAGSCYAITAVGDSGIQDLDLALLDAGGREVDRDHAQDARPVVRVCPQTTGQFTVRVTATAGAGGYRAGLYRWESGTSGAGMSGLMFVRNAEVSRILQADGYHGDANFSLFRGPVRHGGTSTQNVSLQQGACYAFVAIGGGGVDDLDLVVQRGRDSVAQDVSATAFPTARYCAPSAGAYRVTIRSASGNGEFVFRVFRRQAN